MYWNHRVVEKRDYFGELYYEIHEVYYNEDGTINGMTVHPISPYGDSLDSLKTVLGWMLRCVDKPVLVDDEITFINYEDGDPDDDFL